MPTVPSAVPLAKGSPQLPDVNRAVFLEAPGYDGPATAPGRLGALHRFGRGCATFSTVNCNIEWDEWNNVRAQVTPADTVIEFGARYGTTSCVLAEATNNSGRVVSVEPDSRAYEALLQNRQRNRCNFAVVRGTVSAQTLALGALMKRHYNQETRLAGQGEPALPNVSPGELEKRLGSRFTAVLIDCEGCIGIVDQAGLLESPSVTLVLLEEDILQSEYQRYWYGRLRALGFRRVYSAFSRTGTPEDKHSSWVRGGRRGTSCYEYRRRAGLPRHDLKCIDARSDNVTYHTWRRSRQSFFTHANMAHWHSRHVANGSNTSTRSAGAAIGTPSSRAGAVLKRPAPPSTSAAGRVARPLPSSPGRLEKARAT